MPKGTPGPIKYPDFLKQGNTAFDSPLLLFYGEERFFIQEGVNRMTERLLPISSRDFNFRLLYGNETSAEEAIHACQTLPLLSPQRLVVLKNFDFLPSVEQDRMLPYFLNPSPSTCLIMTAEKIDLRRKSCQAIQSKGLLISCGRLYESQIPLWIKNRAQSLKLQLNDSAARELAERIGSDLSRLSTELEKLSLFARDRSAPVDRDTVLLVLGEEKDQSVFDLIAKIGERNLEASLNLLNKILDGGNHPLMILTLLTRQYRLLWRAKIMKQKKHPPNEIIKQLGLHPFFGQKLLKQAEIYSEAEFQIFFKWFKELDFSLKDNVHSPKILLETFLFRLCRSTAGVSENDS